jgi:spore germination protein
MFRRRKKDSKLKTSAHSENFDQYGIDDYKPKPIFPSIDENEKFLKQVFADNSDVVIRKFQINNGPFALILHIDGLTNTLTLDDTIKTLMVLEGNERYIEQIKNKTLPISDIVVCDNFGDLFSHFLSGDSILLVDGEQTAISMGLRAFERRMVSEPETETSIRGPREGFTENLRTNTSLIRRKIKSPRLKMKPFIIGSETNTALVVTYIQGLADPNLVKEIISRLEKVKIDSILESGYIEELIQDHRYSLFPQLQNTERPDTVAASLLEGRVAIIVDGTPFVLLAPMVFWQWIQASDDYYERFYLATLLRLIRLLFLFMALFTPAIYIALTTFHQEMIPTSLLLNIAASRENIPFPAVVEAMIMEIAFEALREAGVRLPKTIGQAVSILGALVVGSAAVQAGIVSAAMVIVVSLTGIASFTLPRYNAAISVRMIRFPLMIIASIFGLLGIVIGFMFIIGHLTRLTSFGTPYLSPVVPFYGSDFKDTAVRAPWWKMKKRPRFLTAPDEVRLGDIKK